MRRFELGMRVHVVRDHHGNLIDKPDDDRGRRWVVVIPYGV